MIDELKAWESYYLIVGTAAGALTGLQFVVMTLIAQITPVRGARKETISAFGTPNIVHFCAALLGSAILCAPWPTLRQAGTAIAACGLLGMIYSAVVLRRALRQDGYKPVFEDWLWHVALPAIAYATFFVAGVVLDASAGGGLFMIGGAVLLLVFIGIHNAWDTVTYLTLELAGAREDTAPRVESAAPDPGTVPGTGIGVVIDREAGPP